MAISGVSSLFTGLSFASPATPSSMLRGHIELGQRAAPQQPGAGSSGLFMAAATPVAIAGVALVAAQRNRAPRRAEVVANKAFDASNEVGALAPLGFWDPAGFMKGEDEAKFMEYRAKELKHGRIAMMSILGFLVQPFASSGKIGFDGIGGGVEALYTYPASSGFACLFLVAGFFELRILPDLEKSPGNYGDPLKFAAGGNIGEYNENWRNFELQNGRMAMIGSIGTIAASFYTGLDAYQQWDGAKAASIAFIKTTLPFAP